MLHVQNLHKSYGAATVLADITFVLNDGEHVGLIRPNGSGKSTLLRCLVGDEQVDAGKVVLTPVAELSGGQKTRLGLAALLLSEPQLLLLDEPTNHLDTDALVWLEDFLNRYPRSVLLVSHDRAFLDATVSRILYLDPESRTLSSYRGGYKAFAAARAQERQIQQDTWRRQQDYVDRVQRDISRVKSEARSIEQSTTARQPGCANSHGKRRRWPRAANASWSVISSPTSGSSARSCAGRSISTSSRVRRRVGGRCSRWRT